MWNTGLLLCSMLPFNPIVLPVCHRHFHLCQQLTIVKFYQTSIQTILYPLTVSQYLGRKPLFWHITQFSILDQICQIISFKLHGKYTKKDLEHITRWNVGLSHLSLQTHQLQKQFKKQLPGFNLQHFRSFPCQLLKVSHVENHMIIIDSSFFPKGMETRN